jgi:hypothetical protein
MRRRQTPLDQFALGSDFFKLRGRASDLGLRTEMETLISRPHLSKAVLGG